MLHLEGQRGLKMDNYKSNFRDRHNLAIATMYLDKDENLGGIIRSANAAAVKEVVIVGRRRFVQTGITSAKPHTNIIRMPTIEEFFTYCDSQRYNLCSLEIGEGATNIFEFQYPQNPLIVIGNEGRGVPEEVLKRSKMIYIPQYGQVECLNAAMSATIAMFDWVKKNSSLNQARIEHHKFIPNL